MVSDSGLGQGPGKVDDPAISVIIPCFNAAHFVGEAVESVLMQGREDIQVIVVNDGSHDTPDLHGVLGRYGGRIQLIEQENRGLAAARNAGLSAAKGPVLAFLDADDVWNPGLLERQVALLDAGGADLAYSDAELFGESISPGSTVMDHFPSEGEVTAISLLLRECLVVMSTVFARADAVRAVGGFDHAVPGCEDLDLWVRMLLNGSRIAYRKEPLARRRIHGANMSSDGVLMSSGVLEILRRYGATVARDDREGRAIERRRRQVKAELDEALARRALRIGDATAARNGFWSSFRQQPTGKRLLGAAALTLLPGVATRMWGGRE